MALPQNVILVCAGADTAHAAASGRPLLDLCFSVSAQGALQRTKLSAQTTENYIGISDFSSASISVNETSFADQVLYEVDRLHARGVFADFESGAARQLCAALDTALHAHGTPFFVPASRGADTAHAILTVETAISGGSLRGMFGELQAQYGSGRVATLLRPVSADFSLPSQTADGSSLDANARAALREHHGAQVFFSHELCAKYFTYMDDDAHGHFVLFDDDGTIEEKLMQLSSIHVPYFFALYPDVADIL